jgi:hypothetical protein
MKTSPTIILLAAFLALICGSAAAIIAIRVLSSVLNGG